MKNKVKFGLSNVHFVPIETETTEAITYGTAIKFPGAVTLTLDIEESEGKFYADNVSYFSTFNTVGYSGSLEMAMVTDDIREKIYGETKTAEGVWFENINQKSKPFALTFQIEGDSKARRIQFMRVSAGKPSVGSQTITDSVEPVTDTLNISVTPRMHDGIVKAMADEGSTHYDTFLTKIAEPTPAVGA